MLQPLGRGQIKEFEQTITKHQEYTARFPAIVKEINYLHQKVRMISFLEYVFAQGKDERSISFSAIMKVCDVPEEAVELVVMKTMALELVRGSIDEIDKKVNIDWILPRYLNKGHLEVLADQMQQWEEKTEMTIGIIEEGG